MLGANLGSLLYKDVSVMSNKYKYQRTNGPVNTQLISGPGISTIHTKPGYVAKFDLVVKYVKVNTGSSFLQTMMSPESPTPHSKFLGNRSVL